MSNSKKKVIIGMSGGVDSSVAAFLLKKEGYHVEGLFMCNWEETESSISYCSIAKDLSDTEIVCDQLGITLHTINFSAEYWDNVFSYCLTEYKRGRTPNPDILCNKEIKFKVFLEFSTEELGADYIATGHYVRRQGDYAKICLLRGLDLNKDQSYFLYTLEPQQISQSLFPLGALSKSVVRDIAAQLGLITANKKDSTGICFIGKRKFMQFLSNFLPEKPGVTLSVHGETVGCHQGVYYYTIGQRKGLGIGGRKNSNELPWYVVDKDVSNNMLVVAQGSNNSRLLSRGFITNQLHWIDCNTPVDPIRCTVKTRYRQKDIPCTLIPLDSHSVKVIFNYPVAAVTPGQSGVFYLNDMCLGGGIIDQRIPMYHI
ncbi:tRNA 2-thiouridine(34) synthase MnmA [Candidatus Erwinia haradaeae]|uniref:tRNA-specific 2-thiouridylase MnmA n=1 Tax=Candidatus Erwinia haradaeae TaxID=1922217 RepID=A0A451D567_9GAMM|nr:tRNA 2-thiouridine(34) synthase MnmA [Candidatus Erwinia haradaeae]VFP80735.1 tRNA-specific 2-thiouridylase MnmA [Candidatus Erwinia haradaeae]